LSNYSASVVSPESDLPRLSEMIQASKGIFEIVAARNDREDYVRTLKVWLKKLKQNRKQAIDLVGEESVARYEKFLGLSMIGYHTGKSHLLRVTMRRLDNPGF